MFSYQGCFNVYTKLQILIKMEMWIQENICCNLLFVNIFYDLILWQLLKHASLFGEFDELEWDGGSLLSYILNYSLK